MTEIETSSESEKTDDETPNLTPYQTVSQTAVPVVITTPKETTSSLPSRTAITRSNDNHSYTKTITTGSTFITTKTLIVTDITTLTNDHQIIYTTTTIETLQILEISTNTVVEIEIIQPDETEDTDKKQIFRL